MGLNKLACDYSSKRNPNDSINNFQDEILIEILSRLTVKEAAQTCILSRKWKNLWKYFNGVLDFDLDGSKLIREVYCGIFSLSTGSFKYVDLVNKVLSSLYNQKIEQFWVRFDLDNKFSGDIDRWIDFALGRNIPCLEFDFSPTYDNSYYSSCNSTSDNSFWNDHMYKFPTWLIDSPLGFPDYNALISLCLKSVDLTEEILFYFLLNCQNLIYLSIDYAPSLHNLSASLKLKRLEIKNCFGLKNVDISGRNLVCFRYFGPKIDMILRDVPKLAFVSFRGEYYSKLIISDKLSKFPFPSSQLINTLELNPTFLNRGRNLDLPESFAEFGNLKRLILAFSRYTEPSFRCLSLFLKASPRLRKLILKHQKWKGTWTQTRPFDFMVEECWRCPFKGKGEEKEEEVVNERKHECLKEVEFWGWDDHEPKICTDLLTHLIEIAASIEKITVDTYYTYDWGIVNRTLRTEDQRQIARDFAKKWEPTLAVKSPRTELVIL